MNRGTKREKQRGDYRQGRYGKHLGDKEQSVSHISLLTFSSHLFCSVASELIESCLCVSIILFIFCLMRAGRPDKRVNKQSQS